MTDGLEAITKHLRKKRKKYPRLERVTTDHVYLNGRRVSLALSEYRIDKDTIQLQLNVGLNLGPEIGHIHRQVSTAIVHEPKRKKAKP